MKFAQIFFAAALSVAHLTPALVPTVAAAETQAMTDGEIRRIDRDAKKLTIRHGPIVNLDMPAMTMVFQVKDEAVLDKLQTGDKVRFLAQKNGGALVITEIEAVK